jgi:hypothetical protein
MIAVYGILRANHERVEIHSDWPISLKRGPNARSANIMPATRYPIGNRDAAIYVGCIPSPARVTELLPSIKFLNSSPVLD